MTRQFVMFPFSRSTYYLLGFVVLPILGAVLGLIVSRFLRRSSKKFQDSWRELALSLLASLPVPLLILAALYLGLEMLALPRRYEQIASQLISALTVVVFYFFPAKVIVVYLERLGHRKPGLRRTLQFAASITRAVFSLLAIETILRVVTLPPKYAQFGLQMVTALGILLVFYAFAKMVTLYLSRLSRKDPALERVTDPAAFVAQVLFAVLASIVVLENLGVHLTAIWTTLGVGSVAIALALQETLSNFFAGIYLLADRPIGSGDYIKLDSGYEGFVVHVGWRSTSIRTLGNNIVVVPNLSVSKAIITNYSKPEERMGISVRVAAPYGTDPGLVERALVETAQAAARDQVDGLLAFPEPSAKLIPGFGESTLEFTLDVHVRRFVDQYQVQSELRKRILERFRQEGIEIPLPAHRLVVDKLVMGSLHPLEAAAPELSSRRRAG
ncbi:MAG TPA: mechanosensitive ion channel family protein [Bryobacteraceae bacterium]|nr:mechanosensitive ion channel family protein [Bryobacteraceae bacterium]